MRDVIYGGVWPALAVARLHRRRRRRSRWSAARRCSARLQARAGGGRCETARRGDRARARVARVRACAPTAARTLKELLIGRARRGRPAAGAGAARRLAAHRARRDGRDRRAQRRGQVVDAARRSRGSSRCDAGRAECGGRVVALLELGAGFGRDFTGRENILLNGALHGLTRERDRGADGRDHRVLASSATSSTCRCATYSSGMFVRLGLRDRRAPRRRRAADRRGARGRRRGLPAQVRAAHRRADRRRRDARARLPRRGARSSARASASSCSTAARSSSTGRPATGCRSTTG